MTKTLSWFEIPTLDLARAIKFYEATFRVTFRMEETPHARNAMFVTSDGSVDGALVHGPGRKPSAEGTLVYFDAKRDLDGCVSRAVAAGGRVVLPKTDIGDPGFIAIVADTEGNHVALHAERG